MIKIIDSAITKHGKFFFPRYDVGVGDSLREYGEFSEAELTLMLSFINEGDTVLDIGSNIGAFTIPFARKFVSRERYMLLNHKVLYFAF